MIRNAFEDNIHSALSGVMRSIKAIKKCDSLVRNAELKRAISNLNKCVRLVRDCGIILDDRRFQSSKSNYVTMPEKRLLLNLPAGAPIPDKWAFTREPNGTYVVTDRTKGAGQPSAIYKTVTAREMDQLRVNALSGSSGGYTPRSAGLSNIAYRNGTGINGAMSMYGHVPVQADLYQQDESKLVRAIGAVSRAANFEG